jgi:hypothetical protein
MRDVLTDYDRLASDGQPVGRAVVTGGAQEGGLQREANRPAAWPDRTQSGRTPARRDGGWRWAELTAVRYDGPARRT